MILHREALRPGDAGVAQTVRVMARLAHLGAPAVRRMMPRPRHPTELRQLVADRVEYLADPIEAEVVRAPWRTLTEGVGDCDCIATLMASASIAAGWPARYVTVGSGPAYTHVYAEAWHGGQWHDLDLDPLHGATRRGDWPVTTLQQGPQGYPSGGGQQQGNGWVEDVIREAGQWIRSLFGGQAAERNRRRAEQNDAAARRAAAGSDWDLLFLRGRTGEYGTVSIPVALPYAVSPSTGAPETPGVIDGWATGPARRHAAILYARLTGQPDPGDDPGIEAQLYGEARANGEAAAVDLMRILAGVAWDAAPQSWRDAITRGVADRHLGPVVERASAALPLIVGAGLLMALGRRR